MQLPEQNLKRTLRLSHSAVSTGRGCLKRFYFTRFFPQKQWDTELWDAMVGKALHAADQKYLVTKDEDAAVLELIYNFDLRAKSFKQYEPKTLEAAYATLMAMISFHKGMPGIDVARINVNGELRPAIEVPFQINLLYEGKPYELAPGYNVIYVGYIDEILYSHLTEKYLVRDTKTTRRPVDDLDTQYFYDEQAVAYAAVIQRAIGLDITSLDMQYFVAYVDLRSPKVQSVTFNKDIQLIQDWAKGLLLFLEQAKLMYKANFWPRNSQYCISYGRKCSFFDICGNDNAEQVKEWMELGSKPPKEIIPWFTMDLELAGAVA